MIGHLGPPERTEGPAPRPRQPDQFTTQEAGNHSCFESESNAVVPVSNGDTLAYTLGYGTGYDVGYAHGWAAADVEFQALFDVLRPVLRQKRHAELAAARKPTDEPCQLGYDDRCKGCSRCTRAEAVHHNARRYGRGDYPGAHVPPTLAVDICPKCVTTRTTPIRRAGRIHPTLCRKCTEAEVGQ